MHEGEAPLWDGDGLDWSCILWAGLATCTELGVFTPCRHIQKLAMLDHAGCHKLPRGTYACMASSWTALKTPLRSGTGMSGLGWLMEMSQITCCPGMSTWRSCKEVELAASGSPGTSAG
jgi:hypothetical protein